MYRHVKLDIQHKLVKPSGEDFALQIQAELDLSAALIGVYGGSGQGKSTLLKIVSGLTSSESSKVTWFDDSEATIETTTSEFNPCVYQSQDVVLFEHLTVEQNLDFVVKHSTWANNTRIKKTEVIDWCGIRSLLNQTSNSLSGGEKQRVGLARSLLSGKPIVILDEPFSALDWQNRLSMLQLIQRLKREYKLTFILVSHSLRELAICCQYLLNIEQGKISISGEINLVIQALTLASSEPLFSRLELVKPKLLEAFHLLQWRLLNSEQSIYIKNQQLDSAVKTVEQLSTTTEAITIEADKVSLSTEQPVNTSVLNQLIGNISRIQPFQHLVLVSIDVEGQTLLSLISQLSLENLQLQQGQRVFAQFKAV